MDSSPPRDVTRGRKLLHVVRPLADRKRDEHGHCSVCGTHTRFLVNSWLLPPQAPDEWGEEWMDAFVRRETLLCSHCSSSLRVRRVADVLIEHYARTSTSIAQLVHEPDFCRMDVAEVNAVGAMHPFLARHPRLRHSEYGIGGEDLQSLSYGDESLDLVLTSDTLEHLPDWQRALSETLRVLRPGGRHVFTVPLVPVRTRTVDVLERGWHHGKGRGPWRLVPARDDMAVHTVFGRDLLSRLRDLGFEPELHFDDAASVVCAVRPA
jgi:SAM-dependent methyltransferase